MKSSLLPEPRSFLGTAITIGAITALPFAICWTWLFATMQNMPFGKVLPFGLGAGFCFGLFFGLAMGFLLKGETAVFEFRSKGSFISRLNIVMSELGYHPVTQTNDFFSFKPSFQAGLAAGRIFVQLNEMQAVIVGPTMYVKKVLKKLDY